MKREIFKNFGCTDVPNRCDCCQRNVKSSLFFRFSWRKMAKWANGNVWYQMWDATTSVNTTINIALHWITEQQSLTEEKSVKPLRYYHYHFTIALLSIVISRGIALIWVVFVSDVCTRAWALIFLLRNFSSEKIGKKRK